MAEVKFKIPDGLVAELNEIAVANGFKSAKKMTIEYWRATIKAHRASKALEGVAEAAEAQADKETKTIG